MKWSDLSEMETKKMVDKALKHISENSEHITTWQEYLNELKLIAEEQGYELTENAEKIAKFRARANVPLSVCPCDKDTPAPYRGCVGFICADEIKEKGVCKCNCFRRK